MSFLHTSLSEMPALILALVVALSFHEYAHAKVAAMLGDPTPAREGRLTINPLAHLDFLGTLLLIVGGFGWAKPVQVNPFYFRGNRQRAMVLVSLAGPLMNLVLAYLAAFGINAFRLPVYMDAILSYLLIYNVVLAVFNLIPLPPLDGSKVLAGILPRQAGSFLFQLESYGPLILLLFVVTGMSGRILGPLVYWMSGLLMHTAGTNFF